MLVKPHLNDITELTTNKVHKSFSNCQNRCHFSKASNPASVCIFKQRGTSRSTGDESAPQAQKDFSNKLPHLFLEKEINKNIFESAYDTKPQIAVAEELANCSNLDFRTHSPDKEKIREDRTAALRQQYSTNQR